VKGRGAYAASKGALNAFALSLARELRRDGVGVNILAPYAATKMTAEGLPPAVATLMTPDQLVPLAIAMTSSDHVETGRIRVAGGGIARFARVVEAATADMHAARGFADAEAAFADLLAEVQAA
jgi:3-hydroxyacyl-CoA dehydrogenase/3a,7a,12a-trihydroxy-5b-cholest-24-enoyl-CoA hydratase